tara:strand:- start:264 stop:647 length:384 start_codon:yes stop_codon:yes gene_type:complete
MNNKFSKVKFSTPGKFYLMDMTGFLSSNNKKYISFSKESNKSTYKKNGYLKKTHNHGPLGLQDAGSPVFVKNSSQHTDKLNSLAIGKQNKFFKLNFSYASNNKNTINHHLRKVRSSGSVPPRKTNLY